ncbi:MaoC family dehydratase N-terminal domain-containing protein [Chloroflexota bacterium]
MTELWGEKEINKAKVDKRLRDKVKADIEEKIEIGKPRYYSINEEEFWYKIENRVATADAIRRFCDVVGDVNPLYRSQDYAQNSVQGGIIAPPHFLSTVSQLYWKGVWEMPEYGYTIAGFDAGAEMEWFKVIRVNDEFRVHEIATKVIDLTREDTALQFLVCADKVYTNQRDEIIAVVKTNIMKMIVDSNTQSQLEEPMLRHFSEDEVAEWFRLLEEEEIRGNNPRFWEDVNVGDRLPSTHHIFSLVESAAFAAVCGRIKSWRFEMTRFGSDSWRNVLDPESGLPDLSGPHLTDEGARHYGSPRANCLAGQMQTWLGHMISNWMGDAGFLKRMACQVRKPLYRESLALCEGVVVKKYTEGNEHLVDLNASVADHNGNLPIPNATATVVLPSRCL